MKSLLKKLSRATLLVPTLALGLTFAAAPLSVSAVDITDPQSGANSAQSDRVPENLFENDGIFKIIVNVLLFFIAAIAVIMLIIGGIRYVVSGGDQSAVTAAKNTILYAIIGIIVAILAYAAVNFVLDSFLV